MTFVLRDGSRRLIDLPVGESLMLAARDAGIDLEGACEGCLACATCHLVLAPSWYARLGAPGAEEEDMLDLALDVTRTSRLSCQIPVTAQLDGLVVALPGAAKAVLAQLD